MWIGFFKIYWKYVKIKFFGNLHIIKVSSFKIIVSLFCSELIYFVHYFPHSRSAHWKSLKTSKNVLKSVFLEGTKMEKLSFNVHHEIYAHTNFFGHTPDKSAPRTKRDCLNLNYRRLYLNTYWSYHLL